MLLKITFNSWAEFDSYRALHNRTVNTYEPHNWPQWLKDLDQAIETVRQNPSCIYSSCAIGSVVLEFAPSLSGEAS